MTLQRSTTAKRLLTAQSGILVRMREHLEVDRLAAHVAHHSCPREASVFVGFRVDVRWSVRMRVRLWLLLCLHRIGVTYFINALWVQFHSVEVGGVEVCARMPECGVTLPWLQDARCHIWA